MKKSFAVLCLLGILLCSCGQKENEYDIIPMPKNLTETKGAFDISDKTTIVVPFSDTILKKVADNFAEQIKKTSGKKVSVVDAATVQSSEKTITFHIDKTLKEEAYKLNITPESIQISASSPEGAFYAVQTIYQLLPMEVYGNKEAKYADWSVPAAMIEDEPRFAYRGAMLDAGRHFMPVEFVKQFIDVLAMHKINRFHWHLTDDQGWRIEIKKYPRLTEIGSVRRETVIGKNTGKYDGIEHKGYYSQEDAKEVVAYASERFITVIPEIELPGHAMAALAAYPELSCGLDPKYEVANTWGVKDKVYCPKESTFSFLENIFTELLDIFPSEYYHIGGDECPKDAWKKCKNCQALIRKLKLKDEFELQSYFVGRIEKFLNAHGKQIIGWDEILEGGLAPNATVMSWRGESGGIQAAKQKHNVIMTPNNYMYLNYYQADEENEKELCIGGFVPLEKIYGYNPIPKELAAEDHHYIYGVQANIWTEYIKTPEQFSYQAFPRAFALAEVAWTPLDKKNYDSFRQRLIKDYARMEQKGVIVSNTFYCPIFYFDRESKEYPKQIELKLQYPKARIHYTIDGLEPKATSPVYETPLKVNQGETVRAAAFENGKQVGEQRKITFK